MLVGSKAGLHVLPVCLLKSFATPFRRRCTLPAQIRNEDVADCLVFRRDACDVSLLNNNVAYLESCIDGGLEAHVPSVSVQMEYQTHVNNEIRSIRNSRLIA
jgi:hypothetical protein